MNEVTLQWLNRAYSKFDAGNFDDALQELRNLAATVSDPWEKAELLYHESMFLLESKKITEARDRLADLAEALATLVPAPSDGDEYDVPVSLPVMARHADLRVTAKEGKKLEALRLIEDLIARYPKRLSLPQFQGLFDEVKTLQKFSEALDIGLNGSWEVSAHLNLGFAEYRLSNMEAARRQFEICAKSPDQQSIDMQIVWEGLEATARALGLFAEAENYQRLRTDPSKSRIN